MTTLTPKQKKLLDFIRSFTKRAGYAPSQQEIAAAFGFRSLGTVQNYLVRLERQGLLVKDWNARRGMRVLRPESHGAELPLAGTVAAGRPIEAVETADRIEVPAIMAAPGNFVLRVRGDSMIGDGILDGDFVVLRRQADADNGQTVVAVIRGEATVKRFYRRDSRIELRPANPALRPILVEDEESFHIDGVVVGVIRHCP